MSTEKVADDIGNCVRQNINWQQLPAYLRKQVLHDNQRDYEKYIFNYSLKNQLRYRGNLVSKVFRNEQRYYELLVQKGINGLCLFPYHLADIVTKGLRVTPFNYYLDVLSQLLRNDKSYDTLPNFTAADCLRVLGIGRNEYLSLISDLKTHSSRLLLFTSSSSKPNPLDFLPRFPVCIRIEPWWRVELGYVLESDIQYVNTAERLLIDDLIDFGSHLAGKCDFNVVNSLYRKGLIYVDVPISGEDRICIPPLRNFVMNRVSGDYFENLLYKIFVSADEYMTISELAQMLQVDLDSVKQAVSLFCRLGFARIKEANEEESARLNTIYHPSWDEHIRKGFSATIPEPPQITPLNYNAILTAETAAMGTNNNHNSSPNKQNDRDSSSIGYLSSEDGNNSDFSFANIPNNPSPQSLFPSDNISKDIEISSELDEGNDSTSKTSIKEVSVKHQKSERSGKRVGFLFDSTLTAFLMMGNLSPGLKNHAVTMFEVGKLCEESMDTFLAELEKVSLLDAEGEGDVSRYFAHAVILRSTICSLRHLVSGGLDLLRLECLESLDQKTRDRVLEKKYKFIISATPLTANLSHLFSIPFFGQFFHSSDCSHMWTKLFFNHISGYGPPGLFLCRGTVMKSLPRIFLGYGKLLVNILHSDSYVINSENFRNINEQLKNGCVLIQGYGIRTPGELRYEAFPFNMHDPGQRRWANHRAVQKLEKYIDLRNHCGFITFLNSGVPDIGCDEHEQLLEVRLQQPGKQKLSKGNTENEGSAHAIAESTNGNAKIVPNPANGSAVDTNLLKADQQLDQQVMRKNPSEDSLILKSPDENYFSVSPQNSNSPSNVFISEDCNELLASELAKCDGDVAVSTNRPLPSLVSQGSVEIPITADLNIATLSALHDDNSIEEEWTLLDVNFGVPLFDVDCNTRICEQIVRKLCNDENLQSLPSKAHAMNKLFLNFIKQCMYLENDSTVRVEVGNSLPHPRMNLAFENGRVCLWSGR